MGVVAARDVVLAHITDAHIVAFGARPTATLKHRSIEVLKDLVAQVRAIGPDCTLFGGDNIDNRISGDQDLEVFATIAESLDRFVCIAGNHEAGSKKLGRVTKSQFAERIRGRGIEPDRYSFSEPIGNVRVIGIDTTLEGTAGGYVSQRTMRFLADELHNAEEDHIVVLGHHLLHRAWEPHYLQSWDDEYLVANRQDVIALLASCARVRAYLCGHHHASRIQRIASRGHSGGFYHVLTASPVAYPHTARILRFGQAGIHVSTIAPRIDGLVEEGRQAVLTGRKARRYAMLGASRDFLQYVEGRTSDNDILLPYDHAPKAQQAGVSMDRRASSVRLG
jgi:3',5'-cyclic AMP phosphodiesterase CpdA